MDDRLRTMEKKMWSIFGALAVISFLVSVPGQGLMRQMFQDTRPRLTPVATPVMIESTKIM